MGQLGPLSPPRTTLEHGGLRAVCRKHPPPRQGGDGPGRKEHRERAREVLTVGPHGAVASVRRRSGGPGRASSPPFITRGGSSPPPRCPSLPPAPFQGGIRTE